MLPIRKYDWKLSWPATTFKRRGWAALSGFANHWLHRPTLGLTRGRRASMREWQKPTIDETESGMEVTSYLPAELDRA